LKRDELNPVAMLYVAAEILAEALAGAPITRPRLALAPATQGPPQLVEGTIVLPDGWQFHCVDAFERWIKGTVVGMARTLRASVSASGEVFMLPIPLKNNEDRAVDSYSGLDMHMRRENRPDNSTAITFSVLYVIRDTAERAKVEWFRDLLAYSLAEA
jgi:hypothetical protein